jgi:hypothetical protein
VGIKDWFGGGNRGGRVTGGRGKRDSGRSRERERHQPTEMLPAHGRGQPPRQQPDYYPPPAPRPAPVSGPPPEWDAPAVDRPRTPNVTPRAPRAPQPEPSYEPAADSDSGKTRIGEVHAAPAGRLTGVLIAIEGEDLVGEVFKLYDGENKLGRGKDCRVKLTSEFISREHALLIHQEGVFAIRPLKDENPVLVNGEKTEGAALQDGDLVRLGRTTFRFRSA